MPATKNSEEGDHQKFWLDDFTVLFNKEYIKQLYPTKDMNRDEKLNAVSRLVILLTFLGYIITMSTTIFIIGAITLGVIAILYNIQKRSEPDAVKSGINTKEGFVSNLNNPAFYQALKNEFTTPSIRNPLMNPTLMEINENPTRRNAAPSFNPAVEKDINEAAKQAISRGFDINASNLVHNGQDALDRKPNHTSAETYSELFGTLGDNSVFESSMRNFFSTPSSRIPNDQTAFANFCYGDMTSCKEGNEFACGRINSRLGQVVGA
jgi:hypothetical protein